MVMSWRAMTGYTLESYCNAYADSRKKFVVILTDTESGIGRPLSMPACDNNYKRIKRAAITRPQISEIKTIASHSP